MDESFNYNSYGSSMRCIIVPGTDFTTHSRHNTRMDMIGDILQYTTLFGKGMTLLTTLNVKHFIN